MTTVTDTTTEAVAKRLGEFLFDLKSPGKFGVAGVADELPEYPGMRVKGMDGVVPLPVNADVAAKLKSIANVAQGSCVCFIRADQVSFANPSWTGAVQKLTNRVASELGCDQKAVIQPVLCKALLYEKGARFKVPKDTETEDNVFATLVVQLPSVCSDGTLSRRYRDESVILGFGNSNGEASYKAHYAAVYANDEHLLETVNSGHRLSLIYSLCWKSPAIAAPSILPINVILPSVTAWSKRLEEDFDGPIAILLKREFTKNYFSKGMKSLKGRDLDIIKVLNLFNKHLSADCKLRIVLADISRKEAEYADHDIFDEDCGWWETGSVLMDVEKVFNIEGASTQRAFVFDSLQIIDMRSGELVDNDNKEWWGGAVQTIVEEDDDGHTRTTLYKKHAIVIYPTKFEFSRILKFDGLEKSAEYLLSAVEGLECVATEDRQTDFHYQLSCSHWETLAKRMFSKHNTKKFTANHNTRNSAILNAILNITIRLARLDFALRVLEMTEIFMARTPEFRPSLNCMLGLVEKFGWASLCGGLRTLIPLLVEGYSIAECLLQAGLLPKNDALVEILSLPIPNGHDDDNDDDDDGSSASSTGPPAKKRAKA